MANDLISFELKPSFIARCLSAIMLISVTLALQYSHIKLGYKLFLLCSMFGFVIFHGRTYFQPRINKCDLLLHLNNAIIWQNQHSKLVNILKMKSIGNYLIIFQFTENNKQQSLLIFSDSIPQNSYKELMRQIKWQQLKQN